ncbi:MAG: transglycosylase, partial [Starkeya sp.]|nr:transglycosylase [Starkeya sp.]
MRTPLVLPALLLVLTGALAGGGSGAQAAPAPLFPQAVLEPTRFSALPGWAGD